MKGIFRRRGIALDRIVLELTERETVEDLAQLRGNVKKLRSAGMRLAADDVGAGNAGLRLLSEIQFDVVKIDLSPVQARVATVCDAARLPLGHPERYRWRRAR